MTQYSHLEERSPPDNAALLTEKDERKDDERREGKEEHFLNLFRNIHRPKAKTSSP